MNLFSRLMEAVKAVKRTYTDVYGNRTIVYTDGSKKIEFVAGHVEYRSSDGMKHREDGPAVITRERLEWFQYGKRHRIDGPAWVGLLNQKIAYFVNDKYFSKEKYLKHFEDNTKYKDWEESHYLP